MNKVITIDMRDTDCEFDFYDSKTGDLQRWFLTEDDVRHIMDLVTEEFGDPAYTMENYF